MRGCLTLMGMVCLAIGLASLWILIKIGWSSDGPGALLFYIGLVGGFWFAWMFLVTTREKD